MRSERRENADTLLLEHLGFTHTETHIKLESGWEVSRATMFGEILTERNVFDEVFFFGSDNDYNDLIYYFWKNVSKKEKDYWFSFILTGSELEWSDRDQALFDICYNPDICLKVFYDAIKVINRKVKEKISRSIRLKGNNKQKFVEVDDINNQKEIKSDEELQEDTIRKEKENTLFIKYITKMLKDFESAIETSNYELPKDYDKTLSWKNKTMEELLENDCFKKLDHNCLVKKAKTGTTAFRKPILEIDNWDYERRQNINQRERTELMRRYGKKRK